MINIKPKKINTILELNHLNWADFNISLKINNYFPIEHCELLDTIFELKKVRPDIRWSDLNTWLDRQTINIKDKYNQNELISIYVTALSESSSKDERLFILSVAQKFLIKYKTKISIQDVKRFVYTLSNAALKTGLTEIEIKDKLNIIPASNHIILLSNYIINKNNELEHWVNERLKESIHKRKRNYIWPDLLWISTTEPEHTRDLIIKALKYTVSNNQMPATINYTELLNNISIPRNKNESRVIETFCSNDGFIINFNGMSNFFYDFMLSDECDWKLENKVNMVERSFHYYMYQDLFNSKDDKLIGSTFSFLKYIFPYCSVENRLIEANVFSESNKMKDYLYEQFLNIDNPSYHKWLFLFPEKHAELLNIINMQDILGLSNATSSQIDTFISNNFELSNLKNQQLPELDIQLN